jgi:hypothetical protein
MPIIFGKDSADNILPLLLDASGNIIVSASQLTTTGGKIAVDASGNVLISQTEPSILNPTQKIVRVDNSNLPAGTSVQTVATIPANQIWRMTTFCMQYSGTVAGVSMRARLNDGVTTYPFLFQSTVVSAFTYSIVVNMLLIGGWSADVSIGGATLNDDFTGIFFGERIK